MEMRPDYTVSVWPSTLTESEANSEAKMAHIHFDAKYKFSRGEDEEVYRREDLHKMHAYKDAIHNTYGAYILYPGEVITIHREQDTKAIPGIGAFPARPREWHRDKENIRQFLIEAITCLNEQM